MNYLKPLHFVDFSLPALVEANSSELVIIIILPSATPDSHFRLLQTACRHNTYVCARITHE